MVQGLNEGAIQARLDALFDEVSLHTVEGASARYGQARTAGHAVCFFASDPARARGAIGVADGHALSWAIAQARAQQLPLVWLLDSAGAKVDEGLPALAAFRKFFRDALDAREAGVRILAILGRGCYGGASLLAMLADARLYAPDTRFATSGPAIIEAVEGTDRFNSKDSNAVTALLGAEARARHDARGHVTPESDLRERMMEWLEGRLLTRAPAFSDPPPAVDVAVDQRARLRPMLPPGYVADTIDNIVRALPPPGSGKAVFCGYLGGQAVGAADAAALAAALDEISSTHPKSPVVLLLDASGHAAHVADEAAVLARHLTAISLQVMRLRARTSRQPLDSWAGLRSGVRGVRRTS